MIWQLVFGGFVSFLNFGLHAVVTALIVEATHRTGNATFHLGLFVRIAAMLMVTLALLTATHCVEIAVWAAYYVATGIMTDAGSAFEFAFENYTALGYGDLIPPAQFRLTGPITALNGLLLIGWSVAIIFEVLRAAELEIRPSQAPRRRKIRRPSR